MWQSWNSGQAWGLLAANVGHRQTGDEEMKGKLSLLTSSAAERLSMAACVLALLWLAVMWAL